ncbi:hypothetical protein [Rhodococcus sp. NPDC055024]
MALDPITFSYPTQFEDDDSIITFIGNTQANDKGIEVQVWRWNEPTEPVRITMNLDLIEATGFSESIIELDQQQAQELRVALRQDDLGMRWLLQFAAKEACEASIHCAALIALLASSPAVNAKLRDLVDGALIAMSEHAQIPA